MRNNSFWNDAEIKISFEIIKTLLLHDIPSSDIGVISLCKLYLFKHKHILTFSPLDKEQSDRLSEQVSSASNKKSIQISTVDAFQVSIICDWNRLVKLCGRVEKKISLFYLQYVQVKVHLWTTSLESMLP